MKPLTRICLIAVAIAPSAFAENSEGPPTFEKDIMPILQEHCQDCHRPAGLNIGGMIAPMSLMDFQETRPWAKSIMEQVQSKEMPPWDASPEFKGHFRNERYMSDEEIATVVEWVRGGAPRGNPADAPPPVEFSATGGWTLPEEPDLVLTLPEKVWVDDDVKDWQPTYLVELTEEMLPEDRWIRAIEFKADSNVVHHIVGYAISPDGTGGSGFGRGMLGGMAPGSELDVLPEGYGMKLAKGSTIAFSMHYHKEAGPGTGAWDLSSMAIWFHEKPVRHDVRWEAIGSADFEVPPHHPGWKVGASQTFESDTLVLALSPHMHFRGRSARYVAHYPDGTSETLIDVPGYDYDWQIHYTYAEPKFIPAGSRIDVTMYFDNSTENEWNPAPDKSVDFGLKTDDEMAFGWIDYCNAIPMSVPEMKDEKNISQAVR